jgi:hypothetical protein
MSAGGALASGSSGLLVLSVIVSILLAATELVAEVGRRMTVYRLVRTVCKVTDETTDETIQTQRISDVARLARDIDRNKNASRP